MERPKLTGHCRLPASVIDKDEKCQNCHQPGATKMCSGCKISDVGSICTRYCSEACQKQHWSLHKPVCRDRRRLARAVRLLTEIWEAFSTLAYDRYLTYKVEEDGLMSAHDEPDLAKDLGWTGETIFRNFHENVVPHGADDGFKQAVLHDSSCCEILSVGLKLVELFLKPVCCTIQEASVRAKYLAMFIIPPRGVTKDFNSHWVLRVKVDSGESFAIDIAGAQFGWQEKMYEWDVYVQHRVTLTRRQKLGVWADFLWAQMMGHESNTIQRQAYELRREICSTTEVALKAVLVKKNTNVLSLVSTPNEAAFSAQKTELFDRAVSCIKETIHEITVVQARGRWYMELKEVAPGNITVDRKVVDEEGFAKKMEKTYFTPQQIEELRSLSVGKPGGLEGAMARAMYLFQKHHDCFGHQGGKARVWNV
ncbi:unnamed protein product [Clonostachys rosea]|uniref:MYND-type domain-containing protein n=1 Tax=Bionectria ochroleuca TaxID=29856 RepID=A0ABY6UFB9_BIOOC|nr:unnamed protein product [Clonostachys rosea]